MMAEVQKILGLREMLLSLSCLSIKNRVYYLHIVGIADTVLKNIELNTLLKRKCLKLQKIHSSQRT